MVDIAEVRVYGPEDIQSLASVFEALDLELQAMMGLEGENALSALFSRDFLRLAREAYDDDNEGYGLRRAIEELITEARDTSEAGADGYADLQGHGLIGAQLAFKLNLVQSALVERNAILRAITDGRKPSLLDKAQKKVLEAIDLLLGSFGEALGVGGMVEEFKAVFELAL